MKWTTTAGPRQTKQVEQAIKDLTWAGKTYTEVNGVVGGEEHRSTYMNLFGGGREDVSAKLQEIGERFGWSITIANHKEIIAACVEATAWAKSTIPEIDKRRTVEQVAESQKIWQENEEKNRLEGEARKQRREALPAKYPHLLTIQANPKTSSHALGAKNLRLELARAFQGVKFSVKSDSFSGGDSIDVDWTDGPTTAEVKQVADRYMEGSFDGMTDSYNYDSDRVFTDVFGGAKYVQEQRKASPDFIRRVALSMGYSEEAVSFDEWGNLKMTAGYDEERRVMREVHETTDTTTPPASTTQDPPAPLEGVTVTENEEHDGVEIRFPAKPATEVLDSLKARGFRWSKFSACWYRKRSPETLAFAQSFIAAA